MRRITIPPDMVRAVDEIEQQIVGPTYGVPVIRIVGGLPASEQQRPHCAVRYGKHVWHRTADEGEDEAAFLKRVKIEADLRGGHIVAIGGLGCEPRDDGTDEVWYRVE